MVVTRYHLPWAMALVLGLTSGAATAAVVAQVDRNRVAEGEFLTLTLEGGDGEPDLEPLRQDFEVQGTNHSSQIQIINGKVNSRSSWSVQLSPKHDGTLQIPALTFGSEKTEPIAITVDKAGKGVNVSGNDDLFLELEVSPHQVYVREQAVLTIRFYQAIDIREGSLSKPELADAVVEKLGDDKITDQYRDGVRYHVTERRFAIFPQASGRLNIPPVVFDGQMVVANRSPRAFGGFDPFDRFFQQARPVRLRSDGVELEVLPQPVQTGGAWLPVQQLTLEESWAPDPPVFKVGEPVTRTLRLQATGSVDSQLPDLAPAVIDGIKFYPDQPVSKTAAGAEALQASKEFKIALMPTTAGNYTLPEIEVPWWNTKLRRMETARLPARQITVAGGVPAATPAPVAAGSAPAMSAADPSAAPAAVSTVAPPGIAAEGDARWRWLTLAALLLWLLTLGVWWRERRNYRRPVAAPEVAAPIRPDFATASREFDFACEAQQPQQAAAALVRLVSVLRADPGVKNLGQVRELFSDAPVVEALQELQRQLYSRDGGAWQGQQFKALLQPVLRRLRPEEAKRKRGKGVTDLPELYSAG